jgi:hypothetical protein
MRMDDCYREAWCDGMHSEASHAQVARERAVFATVMPDGDPDTGQHVVLFMVLPLLHLIAEALGVPRCQRCGKIGPDCPVGHKGDTIFYCGID